MIIGDAFPPDQQRAYFLECFKPGRIFYLRCNFTTPPKEKFLLLVCIEPEPLFFVINSQIYDFYQTMPHLRDCQVLISCDSHTFLNRDSFIDCVKVIRDLDQSSVQNQVVSSMMRIKGVMDGQCKSDVIAAVRRSRSLEQLYKSMILRALSGI